MAVDTFIMRKEWLEHIKPYPREVQVKIITEIVRYGCGEELWFEDDPAVSSILNCIKGSIDYSKGQYEKKVEMSQNAGRTKKVSDDEICRLAKEGMSSAAIAQQLGVSKSTIDHSDGWRRRKEKI